MKNRLKFTLSLLILLTAPVNLVGSNASYMADFETSAWAVDGSIFECRLQQQIPRYGQAVFYHQSGEQVLFHLQAPDSGMETGRALMTSVPPRWRHGLAERELGYVDVFQTSRPLSLDPQRTRLLMNELQRGMVPTVVQRAWYDADESVRIGVSPVNFAGAYAEYLSCAADLLPVNFAQIERSTVFWQVNQRLLSDANRKQLDDIIAYAKADPGIFSFEINGFTDASGTNRDNLELSRIRAYAVHEYLVQNGIDENLLATRYFGATEEFRIVRNEQNAADRDRNRRVTILIRRR